MHVEAFVTAGTSYRVLALFYRQADYRFAIFALTVAADFPVLPPVTQIRKIILYLLPDAEKLSVFLAAFINVLGKISVERPKESCIRENYEYAAENPCQKDENDI